MKGIIAVDLDDVLAASAQGFVGFSNKRWGTNLTIEDFSEHWGEMWQVDHEEYVARSKVVYKSRTILDFAKVDRALEVLKELSKKYKLVITTSRVRAIQEDTHLWLSRHYEGLFEEVHLAGFYDTISENSHKMTKAELCKSIGADFLIDDQPKHCLAAADAGVSSILFGNYPWNRNVGRLPKGVVRAKNWQEVLEFFDGKQ